MARKFLLPLLAVIIIIAMVIPGCGTGVTTYALTMAVNDTDMGAATDVTGGSPYEAGTVVDIEAVPAEGYYFINWSAPAGTFGAETAAVTTFTMPAAAVTVTANFDVLPEGHYSLTMAVGTPGGGQAIDVAGVGHYLAGSTVEVKAKPTWSVYVFDEWSSAPVLTFADDGDATTTFTMPSAHVTVTGTFLEQDVALPYYNFITDQYAAHTLGDFDAEIETRMGNLYDFGASYGHYWVGAGPMYLSSVAPTAKSLELTRFAAYPDDANKFTTELLGKTGPARTGSWVDSVLIWRVHNETTGISQLLAGEYEIYAHSLAIKSLFDAVDDDPDYWYKEAFGSWNVLRPNTYGPYFDNGMPNPFSDYDVQAAWQKLIDREHIADDIMGGLAAPRYTALGMLSGDRLRYLNVGVAPGMTNTIEVIEGQYAYDDGTDPGQGLYEFREAVTDLGVDIRFDSGQLQYLDDATWKQIEVKVAIRSDDPQRDAIGDYVVSQLTLAGFLATPVKGDMATIYSPLVQNVDAGKNGDWTFYTGGWVSTVISRDDGDMFYWFHSDCDWLPAFFYLPGVDWDEFDLGNPQAEPFLDATADLIMLNFEDMDERQDMFDVALGEHMRRGLIYLVDRLGFTGMSNEVDVAADLSGGVYGSWMWAFTVHFTAGDIPAGLPEVGGDMRIALFDLLVDPWNPVDGSNTVYDMFPIRATGDMAHHPHTTTGLRIPGRLEKAEVYVPTGTPAGGTLAWVDFDATKLATDPVFIAPDTAWGSWDPLNFEPITVGDRFAADPSKKVANRVSVAYYPEGTISPTGHPLHDGSEVSFADFLMYWILEYDRGMPDSGIYDEEAVSGLGSLHSDVIGVEFDTGVTGYDLVVTTWSTTFALDAELMVSGWWPNYDQGNGFWHPLAIAAILESQGGGTFGQVKANDAAFPGRYWMSFITGQGIVDIAEWLIDEGYDA